jgi:hypothetical protein
LLLFLLIAQLGLGFFHRLVDHLGEGLVERLGERGIDGAEESDVFFFDEAGKGTLAFTEILERLGQRTAGLAGESEAKSEVLGDGIDAYFKAHLGAFFEDAGADLGEFAQQREAKGLTARRFILRPLFLDILQLLFELDLRQQLGPLGELFEADESGKN